MINYKSLIKLNLLALIIILFLFLNPKICFTYQIIILKNDSQFITSQSWEKNNQIFFYYFDGIIGIEKGFIKEIKESDLPLKEVNTYKSQEETKNPNDSKKESEQGNKIDTTTYTNKYIALKEKHKDLMKQILEASNKKNWVTKENLKKEVLEVNRQLKELYIDLKNKNNGKLPDGITEF
ncbi:MAG: hypothetical protein HQK79_15180 [Desulfobacterales bacterium]|nr:hypothetical protein [Desulfobacterales bacterium]MBF0398171.1 hypothetical protein [Desulfobacterales bacterium]